MTPDEYCQQRTAASGSSFYYSFIFLPPEQRRAITALYAFCREVDDVVDEVTEDRVARLKLDWWRHQVALAFGATATVPGGEAPHPVTRALGPTIAAFSLPRLPFDEIIDGMQMDLDYNRYETFADLRLYCHRVAGAVGLLSARIFGYSNEATLDYADRLGIALQLTNIVRDVAEDAQRNRIYLPLEDLSRFAVSEDDLIQRRDGPAVRALITFEIDRADQHYAEALALLPPEDRRAQRTGLIMAAIYRTLLAEIRDGGATVLTERTSLTPLRKLWIAWKTARAR
ncbi:MAG: presqualene diphosphate synthase HpnD [Rhodocyclaceae bacterium]|nr:presqualene diphosphate synthase HpnD [Rhodocyclaceae bacterium]MCE2979804.1 presqualene diphosphate synthase HpnD [Betaproteobacteria bacterium]MCA3073476.1 presqualene diphosphate synthase HpnD [Rhodocyclaceae bacterium]MCA3089485.1 presqualene diphosphate synthase HpnD [Rhodocyclaceae bacterium]MCA3093046.1 presqualene diphosphate synthase HpnD [Rhodocyclaceae bacterium]